MAKPSLTPEQEQALLERRDKGATIPDLAAEFGTSTGSVSRCLKRNGRGQGFRGGPRKDASRTASEGRRIEVTMKVRKLLLILQFAADGYAPKEIYKVTKVHHLLPILKEHGYPNRMELLRNADHLRLLQPHFEVTFEVTP